MVLTGGDIFGGGAAEHLLGARISCEGYGEYTAVLARLSLRYQ